MGPNRKVGTIHKRIFQRDHSENQYNSIDLVRMLHIDLTIVPYTGMRHHSKVIECPSLVVPWLCLREFKRHGNQVSEKSSTVYFHCIKDFVFICNVPVNFSEDSNCLTKFSSFLSITHYTEKNKCQEKIVGSWACPV